MKHMPKKCACLFAAAVLASNATVRAQEESNFDAARATLEKWVETRQLISKEKSDWAVESQSLNDSVSLLKNELSTLEENISKAEEDTTAADKEREKLLEDNATLKDATAAVGGLLTGIESRLLKVVTRLPADLRERQNIQQMVKRIPKNAANTKLSLSERLQTIVVLLTEMEKFNAALNIAVETRRIPSGDMVQVTTIYLGLAQGYYVDATRKYAGVLTPGPEGWVATDRDDLAPLIGDVLDLYNKQKQPPQFVSIPVEVR